MAPSKKSKNVNRRFANYNESSSQKDDVDLNKSRQRKRKFSNLGSQWSNEELEHFYIAYRKYGKDWKKVAGAVRNRSVEMVEALYNMNKAYLSLPEGTASVVGLIAMMTDHYNILDASDSEPEKIGSSSLSRKTQKRKHAKVQSNGIRDDSSSPSTTSKNGSLLNRIRTDGCAVRKRTPRFPVRFSCREDDNGNHVSSPNKTSRKLELDDNIEDMIAVTLTEASQKISSLHASQSPFRTENFNSSSFRDHGKQLSQTGAPHLGGPAIRGDSLRSNTGSRDAKNKDYGTNTSSLDIGVGMEVYKKGGKFYSGKAQNKDVSIKRFDDGQEACSHDEVADMKTNQSPFLGKRKRSKTQSAHDESSLFVALNTLVDACMLMPPSTEESESSAHVHEEKENFDFAGKSGVHVTSSKQRDETEVDGATETSKHGSPGIETSAPKRSRNGKNLAAFVKVIPDSVQQSLSPNKRKCLPLLEASVAEVKSAVTGQRFDKINSPQELGEDAGPAECSSTSDQMRLQNISEVSTAEVPARRHATAATSQRRIRKKDPVHMKFQKEIKSSRDESRNQFVLQDGERSLKDQLSCCLSSLPLRRWCTYEWLYSAVDYPWFLKSDFVDYLNHVGLDHTPRLTQVEWSVIRNSLGKPRRFSEHFLNEEKEKLKSYRESVRQHYAELHAGVREGLPTDLARPLSVGQPVIAIHPKSRELHDGNVLTVDFDKYKIQFDRTELGVELVKDFECMPLNPMQNIPEILKRRNIEVYKYYLDSIETRAEQLNRASVVLASNGFLPVKQPKGNSVGAISQAMATVGAINAAQTVYGQPCSGVNIHAREADIQALTELTCALDKKEAMVMQLKRLNDEVLENENSGVTLVKDSELFRRQYATVLLKLKEASDQVSSCLVNLRHRNTYPGNSLPPFQKSCATTTDSIGALPCAAHPKYDQEPGCNVVEIVKDSTSKAQMMVDAALQALSLVNKGEDAFERIGEALDSVNAKSAEQINSGSFHKHQPSASEAGETRDTSASKLVNDTGENRDLTPSKLITSCVATLLIIQRCTDRQYPPSEVADILDSVVTDLRPSCPENLPIYRDIQLCMGRIKTQILALVPS